jgi:DNA processing protein
MYTLSALHNGLLSLSGTVDFSNLPPTPTEDEIWQHLRQTMSPRRFQKVQSAEQDISHTPFVTIAHSKYPRNLRNIPFAPPVLFYKGNLELLNTPSVAIVGSRHCSKDSLSFTSRLAWNAHPSHVISSGLTFGIEQAAHNAILSKQEDHVRLIAILEQGMDCIKSHRKKWMQQVIERGGLVLSAYPDTQHVQKWHYKERNRLLASISDIIIVVEASKTSGSISTALYGVELGKDIYAVPHHPNRANGHGCLQLIEQGANPLWDPTTLFGTNMPEHKLLESLDTPQSLAEIATTQHSNPSEMLEALLELKRLGYIRQRGSLWERI